MESYEEQVERVRMVVAQSCKAEIARKCGLTPKSVFDFIKGSQPSPQHLEKMAKALGMAAPRMFVAKVITREEGLAKGIMARTKNKPEEIPQQINITEDEVATLLCLRNKSLSKVEVAKLLLEDFIEEEQPEGTPGSLMTLAANMLQQSIGMLPKKSRRK